jgi:hypothetical protein
MLFKTGQAAGVFLKHRAKKIGSKAKDVFGKAKNVTKSKFAAGKAKASSMKGKTAQILKGQKKVFTEYKGSFLKTFARDARVEGRGLRKVANKIPNTVMKYPITTGLGIGIALSSGDKSIKLKKSDPNYKALKRAGYI